MTRGYSIKHQFSLRHPSDFCYSRPRQPQPETGTLLLGRHRDREWGNKFRTLARAISDCNTQSTLARSISEGQPALKLCPVPHIHTCARCSVNVPYHGCWLCPFFCTALRKSSFVWREGMLMYYICLGWRSSYELSLRAGLFVALAGLRDFRDCRVGLGSRRLHAMLKDFLIEQQGCGTSTQHRAQVCICVTCLRA